MPRQTLRLIAAAALTLAVAETATRGWSYTRSSWYAGVAQALAIPGPKVLFVGTSRVATLPVDVFGDEVERISGQRVRAINAGQGFATLAEHYLGLRTLAGRYPTAMRETAIFVEAPAGCPDSSTWRDPWFLPEQPHLLVSVMAARDLPGMLRMTMPLEDRLGLAARFALRWSTVSTYRERVRLGIFGRGASIADRIIPAGVGLQTAAVWHQADLARVRTAARGSGPQSRKAVDWNDTVAASIASLAHDHGSRVVFFDVPLSSVQTSEGSRQTCASFPEAARGWSVDLLVTGARYPDTAFPDYWHLAREPAADYQRALARLWLNVR